MKLVRSAPRPIGGTALVAAVLSLVVLVPLAVACGGPSGGDGGEVTLESAQERGSYAQGVQLGRQGSELPFDVDAFVAGIRDGLAGESRLSDEEMEEAMAGFRELVSEAVDAEAADNRVAGETFLEENLQRDQVEATESGLQYEVIEQGDGPRPGPDDVVRVHYRGTTIDGEVFDESYARGEPATFPVGQVIPGWAEGVQLMSVGSKYKFYVPADLAYGDTPPPGAPFGAGATLIFEVELLEIVEG